MKGCLTFILLCSIEVSEPETPSAHGHSKKNHGISNVTMTMQNDHITWLTIGNVSVKISAKTGTQYVTKSATAIHLIYQNSTRNMDMYNYSSTSTKSTKQYPDNVTRSLNGVTSMEMNVTQNLIHAVENVTWSSEGVTRNGNVTRTRITPNNHTSIVTMTRATTDNLDDVIQNGVTTRNENVTRNMATNESNKTINATTQTTTPGDKTRTSNGVTRNMANGNNHTIINMVTSYNSTKGISATTHSKDYGTKSSQGGVTNNSQSGVTIYSKGGVTNNSQGGVTKSSQSIVTKSSQGGVTKSSQSIVTKSSQGGVTKSSQGVVTKSSQGDVTESSQGVVTKSSQGDVTKSSLGDVTKRSLGDVTESSQGDVTKSSLGDVTESSIISMARSSQHDIINTSQGSVTKSSKGSTTKKRTFPYTRINFPLREYSRLKTCIKLNRLTAHCWWPFRVWPFKSIPLRKCIEIGSHSVACNISAKNSNVRPTLQTLIIAAKIRFKPLLKTTCTYLNDAMVHCKQNKASKEKTSLSIPKYWPFNFKRPHSCKRLNNYTLACNAPLTKYHNNWPFPFPIATFCWDLNHETKYCPIHLNSTVKTALLDWTFPFPHVFPCILMNNNTYYCKGLSKGKNPVLTIVSFHWPFSFPASLCTIQDLNKPHFCCPPFNKDLNLFNLLPKKATDVIFVIEFWVSLFICITGLIGSILSFLVLNMRKNNSSVVYLKALAISDGATCIWYFIFDAYMVVYNYSSWITDRDNKSVHQIPKVASTWLLVVQSSLIATSIWLVVFLSCDRYQIVANPLQAKRRNTIRGAMIKTAVMAVTIFLCHLPQLFSLRATENLNRCTNDMWIRYDFTDMGTSNAYQIGYLIVFQGLMRGFIPFVIVAIMNVRIILVVRQATRRHLAVSTTERGRNNSNEKLTKILVVIAIMFLVLILPWLGYITYSAVFIMYKLGSLSFTISNVHAFTNSSYYLGAIAMLCIRLNTALNFFVYILVSSEFKINLHKLICCYRRALGHYQNHEMIDNPSIRRRYHKTSSKFKKHASLTQRANTATTKV